MPEDDDRGRIGVELRFVSAFLQRCLSFVIQSIKASFSILAVFPLNQGRCNGTLSLTNEQFSRWWAPNGFHNVTGGPEQMN